MKGQLTETAKQLEAAKHATQKERVKFKRLQGSAIEKAELEAFSKTDLVEILNETGGVMRKNDTWNDLAVKCATRILSRYRTIIGRKRAHVWQKTQMSLYR